MHFFKHLKMLVLKKYDFGSICVRERERETSNGSFTMVAAALTQEFKTKF